ncbi:MAG: type II toxin-antitoxin system VapC family toxin [Actinomycetota bacterium]|nr:type II toxin-antitoxin system VapC family toxin [Actinomycetota bacterium]
MVLRVFDASAVVAMLLDDDADGRWCATTFADSELYAPHLMPFEVANVIRRFELRGVVDSSAAGAAFADLRDVGVELVPLDVVADRVWSLRANLTAYDAAYVATAEAVDGELVTLDRRMVAAAGPLCPILAPPLG